MEDRIRTGSHFTSIWIAAGVCLVAGTLLAQNSITLQWGPDPGPETFSYWLYYGPESRWYTNRVAVGTSTKGTIDGLTEGALYYFAVTAEVQGIESDFSNEVVYRVPFSPKLQVSAGPGGGVVLQAAGEPLQRYDVLVSTDLVTWTLVATRTTDATGLFRIEGPSPGTSGPWFYSLVKITNQPPQLHLEVNAQGGAFLSGPGHIGHTYDIFASSDLTQWVRIGSSIAGSNGRFAFEDHAAPYYPTRFYAVHEPTSDPPIARIRFAPGEGIIIEGSGQAGHSYQVLASPDFSYWMPIGSATAGFDGGFSFTDNFSPFFYSSQFYRLME